MAASSKKMVIDPHYEEKHADSVTDEIVLALVEQLDGRTFRPADEDDDGFQYFMNDHGAGPKILQVGMAVS